MNQKSTEKSPASPRTTKAGGVRSGRALGQSGGERGGGRRAEE